MVMLVPVDADYRFVCLDVGNNGSGSDAQIFNECHLKESIVDGMIGFLDADELPGDVSDTPYFIVAEDNFAPRTWLMKPFSGILKRRNVSSITDCQVQKGWCRML